MANLMGFKRTNTLPGRAVTKSRFIYQPLLQEVRSKGGIYTLDCNDSKRAYSLATTIRQTIKKLGYSDIQAGVRSTVVFVTKIEEENDGNQD